MPPGAGSVGGAMNAPAALLAFGAQREALLLLPAGAGRVSFGVALELDRKASIVNALFPRLVCRCGCGAVARGRCRVGQLEGTAAAGNCACDGVRSVGAESLRRARFRSLPASASLDSPSAALVVGLVRAFSSRER